MDQDRASVSISVGYSGRLDRLAGETAPAAVGHAMGAAILNAEVGGAVSGAVRRVRAEVRGQKGAPEAVPVEAYCDRIVSELQQQVAITQLLQRRQVEVPLSRTLAPPSGVSRRATGSACCWRTQTCR